MKPDAKKDDPIPNLYVFNGAMKNVVVSLKYRYLHAMEKQEIIGPELKIKVMMEACIEVPLPNSVMDPVQVIIHDSDTLDILGSTLCDFDSTIIVFDWKKKQICGEMPPLKTYETVCYEALNPYDGGKKFDWKLKLYPEETLVPGEMFVFSKDKQ